MAASQPSPSAVIRANTIIRRNPRVVHRELSDEGGSVLLHLDTAAYHGLNPVGSLIWRLLEEDRTFDALISELRSKLEGVPSNLDDEIARFVELLTERDLLRVETPS